MNFLFHFWNLHQISNLFKKKYESDSSIVCVIIDSESSCYWNVFKGYVLGHPWSLNVLAGPKPWWSLTDKNLRNCFIFMG